MYTILVVDDSAFMRKWITGILHDTNQFKVIAEASNGREAIHKYHSYQPDVVILDITMDEMDGVQALKHLVKLFPGVKVVMCSSLGQQAYIDECLNVGAKDFIVKPYFKNLLITLNKVVGREP